MTTDRLRARDYRRLSDAKGGTSIEDQGVDNTDAADDQGWALGDPYIDEGLSASRYARKRRDDFDQLVADLKSGPTGRDSAFGADILMLWESSRGSRRVGEWVSFIELCEEKGVRIWVTTHERLYDPANGRDRKALIDDAVDSEYESYKTHRRVSRTTPKEARKGRPHGQAPYGLKPVYDPATGKLTTWVEDEPRATAVRTLFEMLAAGHSMMAVEREFDRRGYRNASGNPFTDGHLRTMALRHSYAGLRSYQGTVYPGVWDGLVSEELFWDVHHRLTSPGRAASAGAVVHPLTSSLWCARCEINLSPRNQKTNRGPWVYTVYRCYQCGMKIRKHAVDDLFIGEPGRLGILLGYLARPDVYAALQAPASDTAAVREIRSRLAQSRVERDELRGAKGRTLAEVRLLANSLEASEAEVEALEAQERQLTVPAAVLSIVRPGVDIWDSWHAATVRAQRETASLILGTRYLGRPCIIPSPVTGRAQPPVAERIEWRRTPPPSGPAYRR
ncbi:recombinase family protein [Streptomyces sp. MBT49]|uniref:recombinase family protein n=1 Tax=Streptomyces sp. MBT49 TaxID=1488380 RepID=UPI00190DB04F|nr:recombinase family protein [Streptomyces sp. MBT49]MBK3630398.1 recombinase family protein [Streptomyces sp. MBT49]